MLDGDEEQFRPQRNVLGGDLLVCGTEPMTGFYRDGFCNTGPEDIGSHTVCTVVTAEFLEHQKAIGNDLSTPMPQFGFAGLKAGDQWCLCADRWQQAFEAGKAPKVRLSSTHVSALEYSSMKDLRSHAVDVAP
jgi:hypothetical protein